MYFLSFSIDKLCIACYNTVVSNELIQLKIIRNKGGNEVFAMQLEGGAPIYEQLVAHITQLIAGGALNENEKLPAVREVAKSLGINPNTVQKAYAMLEQNGLIYSIPAKGSYVGSTEKTVEIIKKRITETLGSDIREAFKSGLSRTEIITIIDNIEEEIRYD